MFSEVSDVQTQIPVEKTSSDKNNNSSQQDMSTSNKYFVYRQTLDCIRILVSCLLLESNKSNERFWNPITITPHFSMPSYIFSSCSPPDSTSFFGNQSLWFVCSSISVPKLENRLWTPKPSLHTRSSKLFLEKPRVLFPTADWCHIWLVDATRKVDSCRWLWMTVCDDEQKASSASNSRLFVTLC